MTTKRKPRAAQLGVTDAEYDRLLAAQGGGCAICGNPPKTGIDERGRKARRLHADHDHKTMRLRGLLCFRCNKTLPSWATAEWLRDAADYIEPPDPLATMIEALPEYPPRLGAAGWAE